MLENNTPVFNPFERNQTILKDYFKRPAVLIEGIVLFLQIIVGVITSIVATTAITDIIDKFKEITYYDQEAQMVFDNISNMNLIGTSTISSIIPSVILSGLVVFAFIYIYIRSNSKNPASNPQAGFMILYVFAILGFIGAILVTVVLGLCTIALVIASFFVEEAVFSAIFIIYAILFAIIATVDMVFYTSKFKYYKSIKNSNSTITLSAKGAKTYGVFNITLAVFGGMSALSTLSISALANNLPMFLADVADSEQMVAVLSELFGNMSGLFVIGAFSSVLTVAEYVLEAIISLGYKKHIDQYTTGYSDMGETPTMQSQPYMQQPQYSAPQQTTPVAPPTAPVPPHQAPTSQQESDTIVFCPTCGHRVAPDDMFCNFCSTRLK